MTEIVQTKNDRGRASTVARRCSVVPMAVHYIASADQFRFRCRSNWHGSDFLEYNVDIYDHLQLAVARREPLLTTIMFKKLPIL